MTSQKLRSRDLPTLVSICVPTYNAEATIVPTLLSALEQDYPSLEIVVVDDASHDATADLVRGLGDDRIRLVTHRRNRGANQAWNASVIHARGELIKFLHHDDQLNSDCVRRMARIFDRDTNVGLVFCRRHVVAGRDEMSRSRALRNAELHGPLAPLEEVNARELLLARWWAFNAINGNFIGEPVAVMVRREALREVGLFHLHQTQYLDAEMWLRVMTAYDVGFVDAELVTFSAHAGSLTAQNYRRGSDWLDRLWTLETLDALAPAGLDAVAVGHQLRAERAVVRRTAASIVIRRTTNLQLRPAIRYAAWATRSALRRERRLPVGALPTERKLPGG